MIKEMTFKAHLMIRTTNSHIVKDQKDHTTSVVSRKSPFVLNFLIIVCVGGGKRGGVNQDNGNP